MSLDPRTMTVWTEIAKWLVSTSQFTVDSYLSLGQHCRRLQRSVEFQEDVAEATADCQDGKEKIGIYTARLKAILEDIGHIAF